MALLEVQDIEVRFGGIVALDGLTFDAHKGNICALIGPNGAGKTTLFNCVSRLYQPSGGRITFDGADLLAISSRRIAQVGVARTFQNLALFPALSVVENVMVGAHVNGKGGEVRIKYTQLEQLDEICRLLSRPRIVVQPPEPANS